MWYSQRKSNRWSGTDTRASLGSMVQKGKFSAEAADLVRTLKNVLLPTLQWDIFIFRTPEMAHSNIDLLWNSNDTWKQLKKFFEQFLKKNGNNQAKTESFHPHFIIIPPKSSNKASRGDVYWLKPFYVEESIIKIPTYRLLGLFQLFRLAAFVPELQSSWEAFSDFLKNIFK